MTTWFNAPTLADLKVDAQLEPNDISKDPQLQVVLDAAIAFAMRRRKDLNYDNDVSNPNPAPDADFRLGVLRLAYRWHTRRRSPDGLIQAGDLGGSRIPGVDSDIARMLGIDRYSGPVFA
jgi:hypothetical protein